LVLGLLHRVTAWAEHLSTKPATRRKDHLNMIRRTLRIRVSQKPLTFREWMRAFRDYGPVVILDCLFAVYYVARTLVRGAR
jgi:hypothetical protein